MNGQSWKETREKVPLRFRGASLCWGWRVTFHVYLWAEICQDGCAHLARQYIAAPRPWLLLRMESSISRDLWSHVPWMWGPSGSSTLMCVQGPGWCVGRVQSAGRLQSLP